MDVVEVDDGVYHQSFPDAWDSAADSCSRHAPRPEEEGKIDALDAEMMQTIIKRANARADTCDQSNIDSLFLFKINELIDAWNGRRG
jgi:predicted HTH transcriptional regulator